ncbi:hypothetical protein CHS0354_015710 [Potamilus streckersoni]|uniref:Uncharacterized protein n=1 Tax=Potamilus streckersoni TaxID=2493646 RepID=A0AAE0WFE7_9BIVA|nr:hypothetical protein CHS0354_015710 [Potamilus streckersoni]
MAPSSSTATQERITSIAKAIVSCTCNHYCLYTEEESIQGAVQDSSAYCPTDHSGRKGPPLFFFNYNGHSFRPTKALFRPTTYTYVAAGVLVYNVDLAGQKQRSTTTPSTSIAIQKRNNESSRSKRNN